VAICSLLYLTPGSNYGTSLVAAMIVLLGFATAVLGKDATANDWRSVKAWSFWVFRALAVAVVVTLFYSAPSRNIFYLTTALFALLYVIGERAMRRKRQQMLSQLSTS